jgi:hypothetical protein
VADIYLREFLIDQGLLDEALDFVERTTVLPIGEKHAYGIFIAQRKGKDPMRSRLCGSFSRRRGMGCFGPPSNPHRFSVACH